MATLEDTKIEDFSHTDEIHALPDTDSVIYQKANAVCSIGADAVSEEVKSLGGLETVAGSDVSMADGIYTIQAPIVIMDDSSFATYCEQIGVSSAENGSVVLNRIWDNINSNFRYKEYVPFLSENQDTMTYKTWKMRLQLWRFRFWALQRSRLVLREEYDNYALVQFVSLSTWKQIEKTIGNAEPDTYIRILSEKERTLTELSMIETELTNVLGHDISFEVENRVQEKIDNDAMLNGYKLIIGALCVLLAFIGIANVFSNTLGFIRQRKREFARYMSIGMTPEGMRKMFWIEALVIAGRPVLITLPITVVFVWLMITASYLNPMEFLAVAPIVPILLFIAALFGFVALAYYLGGKKILKCDLVEALRTDIWDNTIVQTNRFIHNKSPIPQWLRDGANYLRCNLRDFPDKVINDSDFLHLLAVQLLNLANQDFTDKPVQYGLVQFLNGGIAPDFLNKGTDFTFLCVRPALHHRQIVQALLVGFLLLFQRRRQLHKPLFGQDAFGLIGVQA